MRRSSSWAASIAASVLLPASAAAQDAGDAAERTDATLTQIVRGSGDAARAIAGLAAIRIVDGRIAYEYYSGAHAPTAQPGVRPNGPGSLYRIASISKLVVAMGVMRLVEAGGIDLDADVSQMLGFELRNPAFPDVPITARMLLGHTSSIRDADLYSLPPDVPISAFFDPASPHYADGAHLARPEGPRGAGPGEFFHYANLNYGLLGTLIERASGKRFDVFMHDEILAPLGIEASYNTRTLPDEALAALMPLYRLEDGVWTAQVDDLRGVRPGAFVEVDNPDTAGEAPPAQVPLADYQIGSNGTVFSPQGGLRISARDLAQIAILMMNRGEVDGVRLLTPGSVAVMEAPAWTYGGEATGDPYYGIFQAYGLGVHTLIGRKAAGSSDIPYEGYAGGLRGHPGEAYGLLSGLYYDPATGDGYVYLIGGTPNLDDNLGAVSAFYSWEEAILAALHER